MSELVRDSLARVVGRRTLINTGLQAGASPMNDGLWRDSAVSAPA